MSADNRELVVLLPVLVYLFVWFCCLCIKCCTHIKTPEEIEKENREFRSWNRRGPCHQRNPNHDVW